MSRQRTAIRIRSGSITAVTFTVHRVLSGRARQVPHLYGWTAIIRNGNPPLGVADSLGVVLTLTASGRNMGTLPTENEFTELGSVIDVAAFEWKMASVSSGAFAFPVDTGWRPLDVVVPELHVNATWVPLSFTADIRGLVVVEYEWVNQSTAELAATNFAWGRDPQDFDRG